jgi:hypothetical protein
VLTDVADGHPGQACEVVDAVLLVAHPVCLPTDSDAVEDNTEITDAPAGD